MDNVDVKFWTNGINRSMQKILSYASDIVLLIVCLPLRVLLVTANIDCTIKLKWHFTELHTSLHDFTLQWSYVQQEYITQWQYSLDHWWRYGTWMSLLAVTRRAFSHIILHWEVHQICYYLLRKWSLQLLDRIVAFQHHGVWPICLGIQK